MSDESWKVDNINQARDLLRAVYEDEENDTPVDDLLQSVSHITQATIVLIEQRQRAEAR